MLLLRLLLPLHHQQYIVPATSRTRVIEFREPGLEPVDVVNAQLRSLQLGEGGLRKAHEYMSPGSTSTFEMLSAPRAGAIRILLVFR